MPLWRGSRRVRCSRGVRRRWALSASTWTARRTAHLDRATRGRWLVSAHARRGPVGSNAPCHLARGGCACAQHGRRRGRLSWARSSASWPRGCESLRRAALVRVLVSDMSLFAAVKAYAAPWARCAAKALHAGARPARLTKQALPLSPRRRRACRPRASASACRCRPVIRIAVDALAFLPGRPCAQRSRGGRASRERATQPTRSQHQRVGAGQHRAVQPGDRRRRLDAARRDWACRAHDAAGHVRRRSAGATCAAACGGTVASGLAVEETRAPTRRRPHAQAVLDGLASPDAPASGASRGGARRVLRGVAAGGRRSEPGVAPVLPAALRRDPLPHARGVRPGLQFAAQRECRVAGTRNARGHWRACAKGCNARRRLAQVAALAPDAIRRAVSLPMYAVAMELALTLLPCLLTLALVVSISEQQGCTSRARGRAAGAVVGRTRAVQRRPGLGIDRREVRARGIVRRARRSAASRCAHARPAAWRAAGPTGSRRR